MSFYLLDNVQPNTQQWGYPRRGAYGSLSGTCIVHTAECAADNVGPDGSAEGTAAFINNRTDYGSYHTLVDSDSIIEMVPYEYEAWQDSETNNWAVGISAAVQADHWDEIPAERRDRIYRNLAWAAADFVTYMASKGITVPLRRITGDQARTRVPGFCAHGDSGIDRHDPGTQFDWAKFFAYTREQLNGSAALAPQGTSVKPITEESEMPAHKRVAATGKLNHRLPKGGAYRLSAKDDGASQNFAVNGPGHYIVDLFIEGNGLPAGETLDVTFEVVRKGRPSEYFTQQIHGTEGGDFAGHAAFNGYIEGATLQAAVVSSKESAYVTGFGADVATWKKG